MEDLKNNEDLVELSKLISEIRLQRQLKRTITSMDKYLNSFEIEILYGNKLPVGNILNLNFNTLCSNELFKLKDTLTEFSDDIDKLSEFYNINEYLEDKRIENRKTTSKANNTRKNYLNDFRKSFMMSSMNKDEELKSIYELEEGDEFWYIGYDGMIHDCVILCVDDVEWYHILDKNTNDINNMSKIPNKHPSKFPLELEYRVIVKK